MRSRTYCGLNVWQRIKTLMLHEFTAIDDWHRVPALSLSLTLPYSFLVSQQTRSGLTQIVGWSNCYDELVCLVQTLTLVMIYDSKVGLIFHTHSLLFTFVVLRYTTHINIYRSYSLLAFTLQALKKNKPKINMACKTIISICSGLINSVSML